MWTVIYVCNTRQCADSIREALMEDGFLIKIKPVSKNNEEGACEILVPSAEAEECHLALFDLGF